MNNTKTQLITDNGSYDYGTQVGFLSTHISANDSTMIFYRRGNQVTCIFKLTGGGGAFTEATLVTIGNSNIPSHYIPVRTVTYVTPSTTNTSNNTLGVLQLTDDGQVKFELVNKSGFRVYGTVTYSV